MPDKPFKEHRLRVSNLHTVYVAEYGNPEGQPVLFCHRGPGAYPVENGPEITFFDLKKWRLILFHQRGSGQSTPTLELKENTLPDLVEDIEHIRQTLKLPKWTVVGCGWGGTLALAYAQAWPDRVHHLILQGPLLCRREDIRWIWQGGASEIFPDAYHDFTDYISAEEHNNLLLAYHRRLTSADETIRLGAARRWIKWILDIGALEKNPANQKLLDNPDYVLCYSCLSCHYYINKAFLTENQLVNNSHRLKGIPGTIVQGRYDLVTPTEGAYAIHKAWLGSQLTILPNAGHCYTEKPILTALQNAITQALK